MYILVATDEINNTTHYWIINNLYGVHYSSSRMWSREVDLYLTSHPNSNYYDDITMLILKTNEEDEDDTKTMKTTRRRTTDDGRRRRRHEDDFFVRFLRFLIQFYAQVHSRVNIFHNSME